MWNMLSHETRKAQAQQYMTKRDKVALYENLDLDSRAEIPGLITEQVAQDFFKEVQVDDPEQPASMHYGSESTHHRFFHL